MDSKKKTSESLFEEITPEDSIVPVYKLETTKEQEDEIKKGDLELSEFKTKEKSKSKKRDSALAKLEKLGITQEELSALLG